jgi:hypothetical protein
MRGDARHSTSGEKKLGKSTPAARAWLAVQCRRSFGSIVGSYYYRVYYRGAIRERRRAEFRLQQVISHLLVEVTVIRFVHSQETGDSIGSNFEHRDEVKGARAFGGVDRVRGDELCGRLDFGGTVTARAWPFAIPDAGTGSSTYATACAWA